MASGSASVAVENFAAELIAYGKDPRPIHGTHPLRLAFQAFLRTLPPDEVDCGEPQGDTPLNYDQSKYRDGHDSWLSLVKAAEEAEGEPGPMAHDFWAWFQLTFVNRQPRNVMRDLDRHRIFLQADVDKLTGDGWLSLNARFASKQPPKPDIIGFARGELFVPKNNLFRDWHPQILEYCRTLGTDAAALDDLYRLLCSGDIMDEAAVMVAADAALAALDGAIKEARNQFKAGATVIRPVQTRAENPRIEAAASADLAAATPSKKPKRSTSKGEGRVKLIAALTKHHQYADGGCLNLEPVGNNELARLAGVDQATASAFFKQEFLGHGKYKTACTDTAQLVAMLRLLNGEFAPHLLYGRRPTDEDEGGEE